MYFTIHAVRRRIGIVISVSLLLFFSLTLDLWAHPNHGVADGAIDEVTIPSAKGVTISGFLTYPQGSGPRTCVVIAGGTLSETRDGGLSRAPDRDALKRLSDELVADGYATLRFDKRGFGRSTKPEGPVTYQDQANDLKAVILFARHQTRILSTIVAGESAGAYLACIAAKDGILADGYIFLGGLFSSAPEMYAYNFGRLKEWAERSPENMAWAKQHAFHDLRTGYGYEAMFRAAEEGRESFTFSLDGKEWTMPLERKREELKDPPGDLFRVIVKPVLALQGDRDMNVPVGDNEKIVEAVRTVQQQRFNESDATAVTIHGADHNFQDAPDDEDVRMRDRFGFESMNRPYLEEQYTAAIEWLRQRFPATLEDAAGLPKWGGVQVIDDVTNAAACPGIETVEGRIGPLLKAEECQAHYIEMLPGQFTPEHAHSTESVIFTVTGKWVLCRAGLRRIMEAGSLYHFAPNIPTGYEVPFDEPATILIFKGDRSPGNDETFLSYLRGLRDRLKAQNDSGSPYFLRELQPDHPARQFARKINPEWEAKLGGD